MAGLGKVLIRRQKTDMDIFKPLVKEFIRYYYRDNPTGGNLHIVLDDGNLNEGYIFHCQERCEIEGDTFGYFLATLLRHFTTEELEEMYQTNKWGLRA